MKSPMSPKSIKTSSASLKKSMELGLNSRINFGKYKGFTVDAIGKCDVKYIMFLHDKCEFVNLSSEVISLIADSVRDSKEFNRPRRSEMSFLDRIWNGERII